MRAFVDTNVLVYAMDATERRKRELALALIDDRRGELVISTQVLLELHAVCTRKLGLDRAAATAAVELFAALPTATTDRASVIEASRLATARQLSIFDALIVRTAQRAGCATLLTEDLQDGQDFDGVVVENPFSAGSARA